MFIKFPVIKCLQVTELLFFGIISIQQNTSVIVSSFLAYPRMFTFANSIDIKCKCIFMDNQNICTTWAR